MALSTLQECPQGVVGEEVRDVGDRTDDGVPVMLMAVGNAVAVDGLEGRTQGAQVLYGGRQGV